MAMEPAVVAFPLDLDSQTCSGKTLWIKILSIQF